MTGIDYADLPKRVAADPVAMAYYRDLWRLHAPTIYDERDRVNGKLRVSDAGRCALELYGELHGLYTLDDDYESLDSRMMAGIADGLRTCCMVAAGIRRWYWPLHLEIELPNLNDDGIPGHTDGITYCGDDAQEVIEAKLTFQTAKIEPPDAPNNRGERRLYWIYQACRYAMNVGTPTFVILVHAPAAWHGPKRAQYRYQTEVWAERTTAEYDRLSKALRDDRPAADVDELEARFRCKSCRVGVVNCEQNVNPLNPVTLRVVDELEALT